jgi:hypothetical protein
VRLPDMTMPPIYPDLSRLNLLIRVNAGNRKRGVMAYAMTLLKQNHDSLAKEEADDAMSTIPTPALQLLAGKEPQIA